MRFILRNKLQFIFGIIILIAFVILFQSCGRSKVDIQIYVDNYLGIIKDMKSQVRVEIIKRGTEAIIAYRKSGLIDVYDAEAAKKSLLEGIILDSVSLQRATTLKSPDSRAKEISYELTKGIKSVIDGNIIFASNYSRAKDQNVDERKVTILNVRPGMKYHAEGLSSIVTSIKSLQEYIKDNDLKGTEESEHWYSAFKMEYDNIRGFLKN
jgi:hypothetical protein